MKTIKLEKNITLDGMKKVSISNEFMGTKLVQSEDSSIHINADLFLRIAAETTETEIDDFVSVKTNEADGTVKIEIDELDLDEDDYDLSHRSEITIAVPVNVMIEAETDNHYISAIGMDNDFHLTNENGPVKLEECRGSFTIKNENGPIKLYKLDGDLTVEEENGPLSADNLTGKNLNITSENGPVKLRECMFEEVLIKNENGMVFYESLPVEAGSITIENENGHINLALSPLQGFTLEASAELGQIKNSFMGQATTMFDTYNLEVGDKSLNIKLTTENGMIKISSSDMLGNDFFMGKLDYIKEMLKNNGELGMQEIHKIIGQLIGSLEKLLGKVNEEAVREKIELALSKLKEWKSEINKPEVRDSIKETFDSVSKDVGRAVQEALQATQEAMKNAKEKYSEDFRPQFDKHFTKGKEFMKHFKHFKMPPMPPFPPIEPGHRTAAMQEAARMKILSMLEAGKITAEEAEKLLKAIH
jgi:DUF4097 and DUF4098 domain-containing protein YvlB